LTSPVFLCYTSVRPIGLRCYSLSLDACPPVAGEREGLSAVALAKAEVRVKKALADLAPSGGAYMSEDFLLETDTAPGR